MAGELKTSAEAAAIRAISTKVHDPLVEGRVADINGAIEQRKNAFAELSRAQACTLGLPPRSRRRPLYPSRRHLRVRKARSAHAKGQLSYVDYETVLKKETEAAIRWQEEIGLDVLAHGEFERKNERTKPDVQISASSCSASPSPSMAGCKAMAPGTCVPVPFSCGSWDARRGWRDVKPSGT